MQPSTGNCYHDVPVRLAVEGVALDNDDNGDDESQDELGSHLAWLQGDQCVSKELSKLTWEQLASSKIRWRTLPLDIWTGCLINRQRYITLNSFSQNRNYSLPVIFFLAVTHWFYVPAYLIKNYFMQFWLPVAYLELSLSFQEQILDSRSSIQHVLRRSRVR